MKRRFADYTRLARGFFGCSSLWLGPDHALYVGGKGFLWPLVEEYRRFDYAKIQAVAVARTGTYLALVAAFALPALALLALALWSFSTADAFNFRAPLGALFAVEAAFLAVLLVVHLALGPTCHCTIQTAAGSYRVRCLRRVRAARRAAAALSAKARDAQADLRPGELPDAEPPPAPAFAPAASLARAAFIASAAGGLLWLFDLITLDLWPLYGWMLAIPIAWSCVLGAQVRHLRGYTPGNVQSLGWTLAALGPATGFFLVLCFMNYFYVLADSAARRGDTIGRLEWLEWQAVLEPGDHPILYALSAAFALAWAAVSFAYQRAVTSAAAK
ncbi:MAG: hypothetical protein R3F11_08430 [Verrucomicrobiales bacterium]